jgi:hypothetical protein
MGLIPQEALDAFEIMKQTMVQMQATLEAVLAKLGEIDANTEPPIDEPGLS